MHSCLLHRCNYYSSRRHSWSFRSKYKARARQWCSNKGAGGYNLQLYRSIKAGFFCECWRKKYYSIKEFIAPAFRSAGYGILITDTSTEQFEFASAASEQERGQLGQTAVGGYDLADVPLEAKTSWQGQGNGAATGVQDIICNSTDQSKLGSVVSAEFKCAGKRGSVSNATDTHQEHAGTSASDFEVNLKVLAVLNSSTT